MLTPAQARLTRQAGERRGWRPGDNLLLAANFPPRHGLANSIIPQGYLLLERVWVPAGVTITNTLLYVAVAGAGVTDYYMAVYETDGTRVGISAAQTTLMHTTGAKVFPMVTAVPAKSAGRWVFIGIRSGPVTTAPSLKVSNADHLLSNLGLASPNFLGSALVAGGTPAASVVIANATVYLEYWVGVS